MKQQVRTLYGVSSVGARGKGPCCEYDHLISRELGGADDVANLWPQAWQQAVLKDHLENALHRDVCAGTLTPERAQHIISTNWWLGYHERFGQ